MPTHRDRQDTRTSARHEGTAFAATSAARCTSSSAGRAPCRLSNRGGRVDPGWDVRSVPSMTEVREPRGMA